MASHDLSMPLERPSVNSLPLSDTMLVEARPAHWTIAAITVLKISFLLKRSSVMARSKNARFAMREENALILRSCGIFFLLWLPLYECRGILANPNAQG